MERFNMRLASAERLAASGVTDEERRAVVTDLGRKLAERNILLVDINDPQHTVSVTSRAAKLRQELYGVGGLK